MIPATTAIAKTSSTVGLPRSMIRGTRPPQAKIKIRRPTIAIAFSPLRNIKYFYYKGKDGLIS